MQRLKKWYFTVDIYVMKNLIINYLTPDNKNGQFKIKECEDDYEIRYFSLYLYNENPYHRFSCSKMLQMTNSEPKNTKIRICISVYI